ncbi:MAG: hypothetical protein P4L99_13110, partial [Chthoniobacter sp.]|nr:hypothetical protein [Chthoniobacter sp.]
MTDDAQGAKADIQSSHQSIDHDHWRKHADLLLLKHDRRLYVEVSVTRPTAHTHLRNTAVAWRPLVAADERCATKRNKYTEIAELNGYELCNFVVETYGGLSHEARQLLRTLASHAPEDVAEKESFLRYATSAISVCLQRGNAGVDQMVAQRMRVEGALAATDQQGN